MNDRKSVSCVHAGYIFDEGMGYSNAKAVAMVRTQLPCVHTERIL